MCVCGEGVTEKDKEPEQGEKEAEKRAWKESRANFEFHTCHSVTP